MPSPATASGRVFRPRAAPAGLDSRCPGAALGRERPDARAGSLRPEADHAARTNRVRPTVRNIHHLNLPVARHGNPDTLCDTMRAPSTPSRGRSAGPRPLTTALSPENRCALIPANKPTVENNAGTSRIGTPDAIMSRRIAVARQPENGGMVIAGQDAMKKPAQGTIGRTGFMEAA